MRPRPLSRNVLHMCHDGYDGLASLFKEEKTAHASWTLICGARAARPRGFTPKKTVINCHSVITGSLRITCGMTVPRK